MNSPRTTGDEQECVKTRPVKRRAKGEQTRGRILDATLRLIASSGLRSVTHRAVASEAGVQLSLTTYYFKDIQDLIGEAVVHFTHRDQEDLDILMVELDRLLLEYPAARRRKTSEKEALCDALAAMTSNYIAAQVTEKSDHLAIEHIFFAEVSLSEKVKQRVDEYFESIRHPILCLCRQLNRHDPEVDADLMFRTILSLEYSALDKPFGEAEKEALTLQLKRLIGWILGLKQYR